jgi:hypothetical protein
MQQNYEINLNVLLTRLQPAIHEAIVKVFKSLPEFELSKASGAANDEYLTKLSNTFRFKKWTKVEIKAVYTSACKTSFSGSHQHNNNINNNNNSNSNNRDYVYIDTELHSMEFPLMEHIHDTLQSYFFLYTRAKKRIKNEDNEYDTNPVESRLVHYHAKRAVAIERQAMEFIEMVLYGILTVFRQRIALFSQILVGSYREGDEYFQKRCAVIEKVIVDTIPVNLQKLMALAYEVSYELPTELLENLNETLVQDVCGNLVENKQELGVIQTILVNQQTADEQAHSETLEVLKQMSKKLTSNNNANLLLRPQPLHLQSQLLTPQPQPPQQLQPQQLQQVSSVQAVLRKEGEASP